MQRSLKVLIPANLACYVARAARRITARPPVGSVKLGDLQSLAPVSRKFGFDRGTPVDRYYIEAFLKKHADLIRGDVIEFGDDSYTRRFGGEKVSRRDVLHPTAESDAVTVVADLERPESVPQGAYDCVIATQVLPFVYEVRAAVQSICRMLRPGGAALITTPGISQVSRYDAKRWGDYWRLTSQALSRLLSAHFASDDVSLERYGNVLAATAFLQGLSLEDIGAAALEPYDPDYELLIAAVARRR